MSEFGSDQQYLNCSRKQRLKLCYLCLRLSQLDAGSDHDSDDLLESIVERYR